MCVCFCYNPGRFFSKTSKPFLSFFFLNFIYLFLYSRFKAIPFKCHHQAGQGHWLPFAVGGEKPHWEMPISGHSWPDGVYTDEPSHQLFVMFRCPDSAWAQPAAPPHSCSPLTRPGHPWQVERSSAVSPWCGKAFSQIRCLVREARRRAAGYHHLFKGGRGKFYIRIFLCAQNLWKSHEKVLLLLKFTFGEGNWVAGGMKGSEISFQIFWILKHVTNNTISRGKKFK